MIALLGDAWHVARREHQCDVCFGTIAVGDRYRRQRLIGDDTPYTFKAHGLCDLIYWEAWRDLDLYEDESPDWTEDIRPRLLDAFTFVASSLSGTEEGA